MYYFKYPFGVRLIGFAPAEAAQLAAALAHPPAAARGGPGYSCLLDESLQDPDFYIGNGDDVKALAALVALAPGPTQPALVLGGGAPADLPYMQLARPLDVEALHAALAELAATRADALAHTTARGIPVIPERRRKARLDLDLTDPAQYAARRRAPPNGAVLIVDKGGALRDHVAKLMASRRVAIEWTDSAATAARLCEETPVSVLIINTSTPRIDPYALCAAIKSRPEAARTAVVLMVSEACPYDAVRGRAAGVRGVLDKPVRDRHLLGALKKLLSMGH